MTEALALDPERVQSIKDRLQNRYRRTESECRRKSFWQELIYYLEKLDILPKKSSFDQSLDYFLKPSTVQKRMVEN
jgi:hypothetical protein